MMFLGADNRFDPCLANPGPMLRSDSIKRSLLPETRGTTTTLREYKKQSDLLNMYTTPSLPDLLDYMQFTTRWPESRSSWNPFQLLVVYIPRPIPSSLAISVSLILSCKRRYSLALGLIQCVCNNSTIPNLNLLMWLLLPCERVLHPVLIVSVRVVLTSVCSSRLFTNSCSFSSLDGASQQVAQLQGFDEIAIPDHAAVLGADLVELLVDFVDPVKC